MHKHTPSFSTHLEKYVFASNYAYKKRVLDVGCNIGYGLHILSYGAIEVVGIDSNKKMLDFAANQYKYFCPVKFVEMDLEKEFSEDKFDLITMFDVIEHVREDYTLVQNAYEALEPGGNIIFSIPHNMPAEDHKKLYDRYDVEKLFSFLRSNGAKLEIFDYANKPITGQSHYKNIKNYIGICNKSTSI